MAGNANSGNRHRDKPFADVLRAEVMASVGDFQRLRKIAKALIARGEAGDVQAILAIADRLDGKPLQQVESHNVNENHFVRAPEKASQDDWKDYLAHKAKPATVPSKPIRSTNGSSNGAKH